MKKRSKVRKWKEPRYLLKFKIPWREYTTCYECGGHWEWRKKEIRLFKIGEVEKQAILTEFDLLLEQMAATTTKLYEKFLVKWTERDSLYSDWDDKAKKKTVTFKRYGKLDNK